MCLSISALRRTSAFKTDFSRRHLCQNPPALVKFIIRNRISDKSTQRAKGVMDPKTVDDYKSRSYNTVGNGHG